AGAVDPRRGQARAGRGVAAGRVALVGRRAHDRVAADTGARLTGVRLRAPVAVVARGAVGLDGVRADAGRGVAGARRMALVRGGADDGVGPDAGARRAGVALRAGVPVFAGGGVGGVGAPAAPGAG